MLKKIFRAQSFHFGEGAISGYIACLLAVLCFLGVLSFHFPQYLTTPELRVNYNVEFLRQLLFVSLVIAASLALLNFLRNKNKRLGAFSWFFVILSIALGGHKVEVLDFEDSTFYLGMDWFILDLLGSTLIFIFIEKLIPHRKEQPVLRPQWQGDLNHFFVNHLLVGIVLLITNIFIHQTFAWAVYEDVQVFIDSMPIYLQLFSILLVADIAQYITHRLYHEVPVLWRFHAVHHSAKHMDWLAGSRQHILELIVTRSLVLTPIFLLGFSKTVIDIYVIIVGLQAVFNHANVQLNFGWLKYIIVTPQFHHWHHASDDAAIDRNYAAHFSFLDYLFATAVRHQPQWPDSYGVVGDYVPNGMYKQQLFPFKSVWRMLRKRLNKST